MSDTHHLTVRVPSALWRDLEAVARTRGDFPTTTQLVREALLQYVARARRRERRPEPAKREAVAS